jgi:hypothetical protein
MVLSTAQEFEHLSRVCPIARFSQDVTGALGNRVTTDDDDVPVGRTHQAAGNVRCLLMCQARD